MPADGPPAASALRLQRTDSHFLRAEEAQWSDQQQQQQQQQRQHQPWPAKLGQSVGTPRRGQPRTSSSGRRYSLDSVTLLRQPRRRSNSIQPQPLDAPPSHNPTLATSASLGGLGGLGASGVVAADSAVPMLAFLAAQPLVLREKGRGEEPVAQLDTAAEHELIWSSMLRRCVVINAAPHAACVPACLSACQAAATDAP